MIATEGFFDKQPVKKSEKLRLMDQLKIQSVPRKVSAAAIKAVLRAIINRDGGQSEYTSFEGVDGIAATTGYSKTVVGRATKELARLGILEKGRRGFGGTNGYTVDYDRIIDLVDGRELAKQSPHDDQNEPIPVNSIPVNLTDHSGQIDRTVPYIVTTRLTNAHQECASILRRGKTEEPEPQTEFDQFWNLVTRKVDKTRARRAFMAVRKEYSLEHILACAQAYYATHGNDRYTKHPATFLRNSLEDDFQPSHANDNGDDEYLTIEQIAATRQPSIMEAAQ